MIYTDPELAQLGPTAAQTPGATTQTTPFAADDRAIAEADPTGFLKLTLHKGRPTGVTIIAPHAGDLLLPWSQILAGKASRFALLRHHRRLPHPLRALQSRRLRQPPPPPLPPRPQSVGPPVGAHPPDHLT